MKKLMFVSLIIFALAAVAVASEKPAPAATGVVDKPAGETAEKPWFDLEKCAFCKTMNAEAGLFEHMKHEYHNLESGLLSITVIDKEFRPAFKRAQENMQKIVADMATGKMPYMCEHCTKVGEFHMMNVKFENIETDFGHVMLWTSAEPEVVAKLQVFGARNTEEIAKWEAKAKQSMTE